MPPLAPIAAPIILNAHGAGWLPDPYRPGNLRFLLVEPGVSIAWAPMPETDSILLSIGVGTARSNDQVAAFLTRDRLRELIADLQSIDAQMNA